VGKKTLGPQSPVARECSADYDDSPAAHSPHPYPLTIKFDSSSRHPPIHSANHLPCSPYVNFVINLLKPNDIYICRTAALTSRRYILNIYSTNIHTEYFKHAA